MPPGSAVRAPMESEAVLEDPADGLKTARVSVSGVKLTWVAGAAALVERQTPPPVVPTKRVLPEASAGSRASEVTRPAMLP